MLKFFAFSRIGRELHFVSSAGGAVFGGEEFVDFIGELVDAYAGRERSDQEGFSVLAIRPTRRSLGGGR